ncbi:ABC transporter ATP-binding protein [Oceanirhabdus sp. W0125-5]|uniref:ABC transporter ATP-binding protein n=1 Tax=Oceanirhabdus sp. W0125-5 TaxID=2999116 RepID=UPI0022F2BA90|nr:ABC transporter ATP-binding protein [Oceanirhabdus sp. W0125-5]WBW98967.1 ABC transporter ATP-binding protein [Oceanirhabdus sp. W0125-5]
MENLKKLKPSKELWLKIKWILSYAKPILPFIIFNIVLNSIFSLVGVYNALVSKSLIDSATSGQTQQVIKWLIVMATIMFGRMLISPITSFISTHASKKLTHDMQSKIYYHTLYSKWMALSSFHSVGLVTRITADTGTINSTLLNTIPRLISLIVSLVASFSTLFYLAPQIAIVAVLIGPLLLIISRLFAKKLKVLYKSAQEEDIKYRTFIQESIMNIMIVKAFCMEKINMTKLKKIQNNKYKLAMQNTKLSVTSGITMNICSYLAYFSIFCWGALNISRGIGTYGTFTAMLQLYGNIEGPFSLLAHTFPSLIGAIAATERLMEIEAMPLETINPKALSSSISNPTIEFKNVSFKYKEDNPVLKNINLKINHGETIAFIGPSGEGKTTLIRLLLSLIYCDDGEILLRNNILKTNNLNSINNSSEILSSKHRELISYVPQGNTLFSGTIEDNLRIGKNNATLDELISASKLACAFDFISNFENGFKTIIGEKGIGISEGQAQRISLARAFLRKRPILILDEATSSLDSETEVKILESVKSLEYKPTCIIITHRPSALYICDRIFKLEAGSLKEIDNLATLESAIN